MRTQPARSVLPRPPTAAVVAPVLAAAVTAALGVSLWLCLGAPAEAAERVQGNPRATARGEARIELGRRLFFDPQVSQSGLRSCASCHAPDHGFSDPDRGSTDDVGTTPRHSQTILDAAWNPSAHWDGEFGSVEALVTRRLSTPNVYYGSPTTPRTPGTPRRLPPSTAIGPNAPLPPQPAALDGPRRLRPRTSFPAANGVPSVVVDRLAASRRYDEAFRGAFGNGKVTLERLALAIAAYCYSVESTESPYDRYKKGDEDALSAPARRGLLLFEGRAGCFECHVTRGRHALFTDYAFHNTGVAWSEATEVAHTGPGASGSGTTKRRRRDIESKAIERKNNGRKNNGRKNNELEDIVRKFADDPEQRAAALARLMDAGRMRFSQLPHEARAFKTPTLRDVARRGPYMHDGRLETLEEVVRYYAKGCGDDPCKSERLKPFRATDADVADLVAFLESLTGDERPGLATRPWGRRARKTRLTFRLDDKPLADVNVKLIPVGDPQPGTEDLDEAIELTTDEHGRVSYRPGGRTHMRIQLAGHLQPDGGALVPDTCRKATIDVKRSGKITFIVTMAKDADAPPLIVADHPVTTARPAGGRTVFRRTDVSKTSGAQVAWYEGWLQRGLTLEVTLRLPGLDRVRRTMRLPDPFASGDPHGVGATRQIDLTD